MCIAQAHSLSSYFNLPLAWHSSHSHCYSMAKTTNTSVTGSQQVTSSRWHHPALFSPLPLQGLDPLSAEQATEIYQLATECQTLGSDLAKQFQTICRLEASHCTVAQATTHEMVLSRHLVYSAAYAVSATTQQAKEWESTLCRLREEAKRHGRMPMTLSSHIC